MVYNSVKTSETKDVRFRLRKNGAELSVDLQSLVWQPMTYGLVNSLSVSDFG